VDDDPAVEGDPAPSVGPSLNGDPAPSLGIGPSLGVAWLIAVKDLRQRLRDRSAILLSVVAPLGLAVIFSLLIGPNAAFHASYAVVDLDGGPQAQAFRTDVLGALQASGFADVTDIPTEEAARASVGAGVDAAFLIPQGFSQAIQSGGATVLQVVGANDSVLAVEVARAVATGFANGVVTAQLSVATVASLQGAPPDEARQAAIVAAASGAPAAVRLVTVDAALRQLDLATFFSASMAVLFLFLSAQVGMVSVFEERRLGTLNRILAGPVPPWAVLAGKILGAFVMSVLAMTILVLATTVLIGADWGPPAGVTVLVLAAIVAALGVSALVTSFARSAEAAGAAGSAVAITLAILGGTFSPAAQGPAILSTLALLTPHGWFLRGLGNLHGAGAGIADALPAAAVLLAMGLVTGAIGLLRARRLVMAR
jgi:linearmycin/streptolysin S transport system permease protein